ncbi:M15 family metallopeptidase [Acinetobacter sp. XS-4]|uniref:M15 family metallopeptidase n=1 Tax=Acinetobacter sp. XS-4 TaxID=2923375 RepID=UPI00208F0CBD|nr:M15 family metallopeptidase [Acinetobacter sp. XS-4]USP39251.1 M15 family metallopeptidase [Acinetobacter sp. XS-4]
MKNIEMIKEIQQKLGIEVDGLAGPQTWSAIYTHILKKKLPVSPTDQVDERSERVIATLQPEVQIYARALIHKAEEVGIDIKVISGLRTYAEQDKLYAQGRTENIKGGIVTNAKGGQSNHNFGIAFDIGVFEGKEYLEDSPKYKAVGALGMQLGLEWGGNWKTIVDQPHFQLRPLWAKDLSEKEMLAALRERKDKDQAIYT